MGVKLPGSGRTLEKVVNAKLLVSFCRNKSILAESFLLVLTTLNNTIMKTITTLKPVLLINALSSGATALLLLLFPGAIANLFGSATKVPFVAAGIFLLLFATLVFSQSRKSAVQKGWVKFIIALDVLWVVESTIILIPQLFRFTTIGYFIITAVALWVAMMAILQVRGLKQITSLNTRTA